MPAIFILENSETASYQDFQELRMIDEAFSQHPLLLQLSSLRASPLSSAKFLIPFDLYLQKLWFSASKIVLLTNIILEVVQLVSVIITEFDIDLNLDSRPIVGRNHQLIGSFGYILLRI